MAFKNQKLFLRAGFFQHKVFTVVHKKTLLCTLANDLLLSDLLIV